MTDAVPHLIADCPSRADAGLEYGSDRDIAARQGELLSEHVRYAARCSPFYRAMFESDGIDPGSIRTTDDLERVPCTDKTDITHDNERLLAVAPDEIADVCLTSATSGDSPSVLLQTQSDLARLAYNEEAAFRMVGVGASDRVLVCAALERCFMAGLAYYLGALRVGARGVRAGSGSAVQQWQLIKATRANVLIGVPSLMRRVAEHARDSGDDAARAGVRLLIGIGEATRDADMALLPAAVRLEEMWGAPVYSTYASTEIATSFCECEERCGGHLRPELAVVEILDGAGRRVEPGVEGEVVVTPMGVRGMPLIRFRTGDVSFLVAEPCACGRRTPRLGPILGRRNQMLKFRGTTLFPASLLAPLEAHDCVVGAFVEARCHEDGTDRVVVCVCVRDESVTADRLARAIRATARVKPEVRLVSGEELERRIRPGGKRKRVTFFDLREA